MELKHTETLIPQKEYSISFATSSPLKPYRQITEEFKGQIGFLKDPVELSGAGFEAAMEELHMDFNDRYWNPLVLHRKEAVRRVRFQILVNPDTGDLSVNSHFFEYENRLKSGWKVVWFPNVRFKNTNGWIYNLDDLYRSTLRDLQKEARREYRWQRRAYQLRSAVAKVKGWITQKKK